MPISLSLSYLSFLFSRSLHLVEYIFPFLLCLSLLFFSQLFVRPPQITTLSCISFSWGWFWLPPLNCHMYTHTHTHTHTHTYTHTHTHTYIYKHTQIELLCCIFEMSTILQINYMSITSNIKSATTYCKQKIMKVVLISSY